MGVLLALVSLIAVGLAAENSDVSPIAFRIPGVVFFVTEDRVRLRDGPSTNSKVVELLSAQTKVIPILESDSPDDLGKEANLAYYWYRCVIEQQRNVTGWIYGQYLGCRLSTDTKDIWIVHGYNADEKTLSLMPDYKFEWGLPGELSRNVPSIQVWPESTIMPILVQRQRAMQLGRMQLAGDKIGEYIVGTAIDGPLPPEAMKLRVDATIGSRFAIAWSRPVAAVDLSKASSVLSFLHDALRRKVQEVLAKPFSFRNIRIDHEALTQFAVTDMGRTVPTSFFAYEFLGVSSGHTIVFACYLSQHPDGSLVLSQAYSKSAPYDYKTDVYMGTTGAFEFPSFDRVLDSGELPTSLILGGSAPYEGEHHILYVTNGYIVFQLSEFSRM